MDVVEVLFARLTFQCLALALPVAVRADGIQRVLAEWTLPFLFVSAEGVRHRTPPIYPFAEAPLDIPQEVALYPEVSF